MRKICFAALFAALLLAACAACADTFSFNDINMTLELPDGVYETQLTPANIDENALFATSLGHTADSLKQAFADEGILLMAFDADNDRTFVVTAAADEQAKQYYNINEQTPETRAVYRTGHSNGTFCGALGYKFESCEWKNFGDTQGRFLMLKYTLKQNGALVRRGLWRRTIRNGYTITLDMRITGRQVKGADITALNKIQDTVRFGQDTAAPESPVQMIITAAPPLETDADAFTVKGTAKPGATITAALTSFSSTQSILFTATANNTGKFTLPVTLPREDFYYMALVSEYGGVIESQQDYTITYDDSLLPVNLTSALPTVFTENSFKLTGTTLSGVSVQLVVNGVAATKRTNNNKTFSFTLDTAEETTYQIELSLTKKNYDTRLFTYTIAREMTDAQRTAKIRKDAISPAYDKLKSSIAGYTGRVMHYTGYITEIRQVTDTEWLVAFATKRTNDEYGNVIMLSCAQAPTRSVDSRAVMYGTLAGEYSALLDGKEIVYPKFTLSFFDDVTE